MGRKSEQWSGWVGRVVAVAVAMTAIIVAVVVAMVVAMVVAVAMVSGMAVVLIGGWRRLVGMARMTIGPGFWGEGQNLLAHLQAHFAEQIFENAVGG